MILDAQRPAMLVLEDGASFAGRAVGAEGEVTGEVVFNTSMTGYQEILTDPSYAGQLEWRPDSSRTIRPRVQGCHDSGSSPLTP